MSRTYQATGINLQGMAFGEADRLLTILTAEYGLIKAIAPGARKYKSSLRGRSELFVVNNLLIVGGKSLDKVIQAETIESHPKLSQNFAKLIVSQYLCEVVLAIALSEQPQIELYELICTHLGRIAALKETSHILLYFCQALFHLLTIAGLVPQVHTCVLTGKTLITGNNIGFSFEAGGIIDISALTEIVALPKIDSRLTFEELQLLRCLGEDFPPQENLSSELAGINLDRLLRRYTQYHLGKTFRSSALVEGLSPLEF
jgi:DNA repair protein RecO (recombination protein O)